MKEKCCWSLKDDKEAMMLPLLLLVDVLAISKATMMCGNELPWDEGCLDAPSNELESFDDGEDHCCPPLVQPSSIPPNINAPLETNTPEMHESPRFESVPMDAQDHRPLIFPLDQPKLESEVVEMRDSRKVLKQVEKLCNEYGKSMPKLNNGTGEYIETALKDIIEGIDDLNKKRSNLSQNKPFKPKSFSENMIASQPKPYTGYSFKPSLPRLSRKRANDPQQTRKKKKGLLQRLFSKNKKSRRRPSSAQSFNREAGQAMIEAMFDSFPASQSLLQVFTQADCNQNIPCLKSAMAKAKKKAIRATRRQKHQMRIALTTIAVFSTANQSIEDAKKLLSRVIPKRGATRKSHWMLASILKSVLSETDNTSLNPFGLSNMPSGLSRAAKSFRNQMTKFPPRRRIARKFVHGMTKGLSPKWTFQEGSSNVTSMLSNIIGAARNVYDEIDISSPEVADFVDSVT